MRNWVLLFLLLSFSACRQSSAPHGNSKAADVMVAGNKAFANKQYEKAAQHFTSLVRLAPDDAVSYYNLGNALYRQNKLAPAILNYEKALKRRPAFQQAADNLAIARSRIPGNMAAPQQVFFIRWWKAVTPASSAAVWAISALIAFAALILAVAIRSFRKSFMTRPGFIVTLSVFWLCCLALSASAYSRRSAVRAVVMQPASLSASPAAGVLTEVPAGITVAVDAHANGHMQVTLPDGRQGWVNEAALSLVN